MYNNIMWDLELLDEAYGQTFEQWDGLNPIWGYFVYRVTNDNQALFDEYIEYVQRAVKASLDEEFEEDRALSHETTESNDDDDDDAEEEDKEEDEDEDDEWSYDALAKVKQTFHLCVRDGQHLDGLTVEEVQEVHDRWIKELNDADNEYYVGLSGCLTEHVDRSSFKRQIRWPRFGYFLYVDNTVLQNFQEIRATLAVDGEGLLAPRFDHGVFVQVVQAKQDDPTESDLEDRGNESDEDDGKVWQNVHVYRIPTLYDSLYQSNDFWYRRFARPPRVNNLSYHDL